MCITKSVIPSYEYSQSNNPIQVDLKAFSKETIATLAGISEDKGEDIVVSHLKSIITDKFIEFL